MQFKIAVALLLITISPYCFAEVTYSPFIIQAEPIYGDTIIQARPITPARPEPNPPVVRPPVVVIQERPQQPVTVANPNSARARAVRAKGGTPGTNRCDGAMVIANSRGRCQPLEYDQDYLNFFNTEGLRCARKAAREAFQGMNATKFVFKTGEGQVASTRMCNRTKYSTHSAGRALDIFSIDIYEGEAHSTVRMHGSHLGQRGHRAFYDGLKSCWKAAVASARENNNITGRGGGCLGYGDSNHWDHMHMSLPPTNANRTRYGICST